ncbi:hypothetical protein MiSe_51690 [Microseira wollei NIES-4236]|uniref:Transposase n=1 Tax=Microseira wollei NIES-4236 TaxID=2530354 RepID=A0AAV3XJL9_9CYAN|nr:hypothetical protein MiSe_51690 [Microseira wollei NIES-4236]
MRQGLKSLSGHATERRTEVLTTNDLFATNLSSILPFSTKMLVLSLP